MRRGYAPHLFHSKWVRLWLEKKKEKEERKEKKERKKKERNNRRESDKDAGMRQGDMRQAEKAHCLRTDPGLENWICAVYAPGIKIWRDEPDEVAGL